MKQEMKRNGAVAITDTQGGELISYRGADGIEYVWTGDAAFWSDHAPVLFPIVGALKDGKIEIGGESYSLAMHGFARKSVFKLVEATPEKTVFELCDNEKTHAVYPFPFSLKITHTMEPDGFATLYSVENTGKQRMVFCIGGHAGFCCPLRAGECFSDYRLSFAESEVPEAYYTNAATLREPTLKKSLPLMDGHILPLDYALFADGALILDQPNSKQVTLTNGTHGVTFLFHGFQALGIWTPPGKSAPLLCLEPWEGMTAAQEESGKFEDKPYAIFLESGERFEAGYTAALF